MHIAMWSDSYLPYISGVTRSIEMSRLSLQELGHKISLFCPSYPQTKKQKNIYRFWSVRAPNNRDYYVALPVYPGLVSILKSDLPNIMHIHSPFNLGRLGFIKGRKLGLPVVFTYHTMYNMYSHYVPIIGEQAASIVEHQAFQVANKADAVITPSKTLAGYLKEHGITSKVFVIPNGIDIEDFKQGDPGYLRRTYSIPEDHKIIMTCGRLGHEKNLETLLRSYAVICKKCPSSLVMVGDGPLRHSLEHLVADLDIGNNVIFAGKVPAEKMPDYYAGSDLFLFTSLTDTQGIVLVESKAAGVPSVAVSALGVRDMIIDGIDGFLCRDDIGEIAEKTVYLLNKQSLLEQMKANAAANAETFSRQNITAALVNCYETLIS
jgi:1,2-diacylglycerol 3-alpha-glucosyltransferase